MPRIIHPEVALMDFFNLTIYRLVQAQILV